MKTRPLAWAVALVAALPFATSAPRAVADQISMTLTNSGDQFGGGPFDWHVTSGSSTSNIATGSSLVTYCADLYHTISTGSTYTYTITNVTNSGTFTNGNGTNMTATQMTEIRDLFGEGFKNGTPSDTTAFQLALWYFEYGYTPSNISSTLTTDTNALITAVNSDVAHGINAFSEYLSNYSLLFLSGASNSPAAQNQIALVQNPPPTNSVPAPPAVLLAAFGLIALGGRRSWLRKQA